MHQDPTPAEGKSIQEDALEIHRVGRGEVGRILWICPYLPLPISGAGRRVFNLIKALAPAWRIHLIATANEWHERHELTTELRAMCESVEIVPQAAPNRQVRRSLQLRSLLSRRPAQYWTVYSADAQDRIDRATQTGNYDLIILEHSFTGYYRLPAHVPRVLDQHNVESEILERSSANDRSRTRRIFNLLEYRKYRSDERRICRQADLILAASERDATQIRNWNRTPECRVIPNGVDVREFTAEPNRRDRDTVPRLLFTGPLHYAPNAEAVLYFSRDIWPLVLQTRPDAQLTIVGTNPPDEILQFAESPGVHAVGFVPDVRPYLDAAHVVIAPLRIGGGTRLKILEAMAMRVPVVTTSLGCEGLDVTDGCQVWIEDTPGGFARRVVELLRDPVQRARMGDAGRRLVEDHYDWQTIGASLNEALVHIPSIRKK